MSATKQIEAAYQEFLRLLAELEKEQDEAITDYTRRLEMLKINSIKENL